MKNLFLSLLLLATISCGGSVSSDTLDSIYINPSGGEGGTVPSEQETINNKEQTCTKYNGTGSSGSSVWEEIECSGYCLDRDSGTQCFSNYTACDSFQKGLQSANLETSACYFI